MHCVVRQEVQLHTILTLYCCILCHQTGGTTAHITNPVLLHTVLSDKQEVQLQTILSPCNVAHCAVRQTEGTAAHITKPVLLRTVLSDRQDVQLHTTLTL